LPAYKNAIVGAGAAGYFTAQAFQKEQNEKLSFSTDLKVRGSNPCGALFHELSHCISNWNIVGSHFNTFFIVG
jgi:thioredoxin reductase